MIASYKRKSGIATIVFVVSLASSLALTPSGMNVWDNAPLGPILGVIWVLSFYLAFWWYLKAKGRSGAWMLLLLLSVVGLIVILLLKDHCKDGREPPAVGTPAGS